MPLGDYRLQPTNWCNDSGSQTSMQHCCDTTLLTPTLDEPILMTHNKEKYYKLGWPLLTVNFFTMANE